MDRLLDFSENFVLSSGTIPIDIHKGRVLLTYRPKKEYLLSKGQKKVGETLEHAATRATTEESSYVCSLLPHSLSSNARGFDGSRHTEPIAVQQRVSSGCREIIFWYISEMDSSALWVGYSQENCHVVWVPMALAAEKCSFGDDGRIVDKALEAVFGPAS